MESIIHTELKTFLNKNRCTLLGVGPMSLNCVNASIELSNLHKIPIMLIASRRQIDSNEFGGGYVNNWSTEEFSSYVKQRDKGKFVLLARDHGGPWQNNLEVEKKFDLQKAMTSAKSSYKSDIDANFQILHIDPSIDIHETPSVDQVIDRIFELYMFCIDHAKNNKKEIIFEIGTEEQSGSTNSQEELDYTLQKINSFCEKEKIIKPSFVVIQCGTKVMERRNIGSFDRPIRVKNELPPEIQLPKMIQICNRHNMFMKEHNTDYISDEALSWHPRLGIHAANVAPEFGVSETLSLIKTLKSNGLKTILDNILEISYSSGKWKKWMLPNSEASDEEKSIISCHYIFSDPRFLELKEISEIELQKKNINLDEILINDVKQSIMRYLLNFRLIR